mmetsp:Transcript_98884/g.262611  ORF Transcript_98884/g.262611 Transcript_98884/m.262611 type:complete len:299 (+) Transcript_98884:992-1888(+)
MPGVQIGSSSNHCPPPSQVWRWLLSRSRNSRGTQLRSATPSGRTPAGLQTTSPRTAATTSGQLPARRQASTNCSHAFSRLLGCFPPHSSDRSFQYSVSAQDRAPPPRLRAWHRYSCSSLGQPSAGLSRKRSLASEICPLRCFRNSSCCRLISSVSVAEFKAATRDVAAFQGSWPRTHRNSNQPTASRSSAGERSPERPARMELKSSVPLTPSKGGDSSVLEMPKSMSCGLVSPVAPNRMLAGFRSQWIKPLAWTFRKVSTSTKPSPCAAGQEMRPPRPSWLHRLRTSSSEGSSTGIAR